MNTDEKNCCLKATQLIFVVTSLDLLSSLIPRSSIELSPGNRYESVVYMFSFLNPFSFWYEVFDQSMPTVVWLAIRPPMFSMRTRRSTR